MENITAAAYAVIAGIALVIVLYIAYIAIPLIILGAVMTIVFLVNRGSSITSTPSNHLVKIAW